ncbi:MAG: hypothetical protein SCALA702_14150 [Melioribacteraceae bacterium]|nr:MAG: hypothetical protein SCALA702_14150 [Melioribacteraceae bacterium]
MKNTNIVLGEQNSRFYEKSVKGEFVTENGETYYKISNYDNMDPFLVSIVSPTDHWMYISSNGGLTAGRKNPDNALFPYTNDDALHDAHSHTGGQTLIKARSGDKFILWEPFFYAMNGLYDLERNLYKDITGTKIIFEEINHDLKLNFRYGWTTSEKYGFIKFSEIRSFSDDKIELEILDGIRNILPSGIYRQLQNEFSTLVDGYKKNELMKESGIGVFSLSSIPSDRAQPSESLIATTVFSSGIVRDKILLSVKQIDRFRKNLAINEEADSKGIKGAYIINSNLELKPKSSSDWFILAEINQNAGDLVKLNEISSDSNLKSDIYQEIKATSEGIRKIISSSDGIQLTSNRLLSARHFSNVLFNVMRGGIFPDGYNIMKDDFISFIKNANPYVLKTHNAFFSNLPGKLLHSDLLAKVEKLDDPHFTRLTLEYLPLTFSRRHGDPSRPWNNFSIDVRDENDEVVLNYQGNWRDVFQNWEALAFSYPGFTESMITKFLNNTTADGYNPYRIFRDGFDWEDLEPHNPWANIGYWGDHQVIYLLKLLELSREFNPGALEYFVNKKLFSFANVPYRIKSYDEILKNPRDTIVFDEDLNHRLRDEAEKYGWDTKYLKWEDQKLVQVNLIEKLLLTGLVKMSNFVPGGGIWMNTQRPEWNDANNALVGYGVSMVTLYYLRRYLNFIKKFVSEHEQAEYKISAELHSLFIGISKVLKEFGGVDVSTITNAERKIIVDEFGKIASEYRNKIYKNGFSGREQDIKKDQIIELIDASLTSIDNTIKVNKRRDGLYNAYNVLSISEKEMKVLHLYEMLEGQVAVLSSGYLSTKETLHLLKTLKSSSLYREDQNSYILYPFKRLPLFREKNIIQPDKLEGSKLVEKMLQNSDQSVIYKDSVGNYHFQSDLINSDALQNKLEMLDKAVYSELVKSDKTLLLEIYEDTFDHEEFTGRANTFYKYEGLGSIYWHMVSKLLLAVYENYRKAEKESADKSDLDALEKNFYDIKKGIGAEKAPNKYGAFPTDPYSHTPSFTGVQQPGMTGQVKEDILSRIGELGVIVENSKITFNPSLLNTDEFLTDREKFVYYDLSGVKSELDCDTNSLAFTLCQLPVIYKLGKDNKVVVTSRDGEIKEFDELSISKKMSQSIFKRENIIRKVEVYFDESGKR